MFYHALVNVYNVVSGGMGQLPQLQCVPLLISMFCLELRLLWKSNGSPETHSYHQ